MEGKELMKHKTHEQNQHRNSAALLLIDTLNTMDFEEADLLLEQAKQMIEPLVSLKKRAKEAGLPVIYVNDNYGAWQSDLHHIIKQAEKGPGGWIVDKLHPQEDDYFIVKPKHSGFFSTPLATLLGQLKVNTLIIAGMAGNICVLFTANDAYMRDYKVIVPADCCASNTENDNEYALRLMKNNLGANIDKERNIDLDEIIKCAAERNPKTLY